ncbi:hypothetical protein KB227_10815 (plasmid) [Staphylococcus epidermidis]|nr:hypothetical protein KB227_10815 [Staphylococcus epidermidis]
MRRPSTNNEPTIANNEPIKVPSLLSLLPVSGNCFLLSSDSDLLFVLSELLRWFASVLG